MLYIIGIVEKKMETAIQGLGLGLHRDNGIEHRNYYIIIGYILGYIANFAELIIGVPKSRGPFKGLHRRLYALYGGTPLVSLHLGCPSLSVNPKP